MPRRLSALLVAVIVAGLALSTALYTPPLPAAPAVSHSLRFYGSGVADIDRVKIALDAGRPVNVGAGDFTVELWLKAELTENKARACTSGDSAWITGNILLDRDVYGAGDYGDYGLSLRNGRVAFGVAQGGQEAGLCGQVNVADGRWHHIAVTRSASSGSVRLFIDGTLDTFISAPRGDLRYRVGRPTSYPRSDPFLVIGAEKHDVGAAYPSFSGWIDELRFSTTVRYQSRFTPPAGPFASDEAAAALYHFDEGQGDRAGDSASASGGPSDGLLRPGGRPGHPSGPIWSTDTPWTPPPAVTPSPTASSTFTPTLTPTPTLALTTPTATRSFSSTATPTLTTARRSPTPTATIGTAPPPKHPIYLPLLTQPEKR